MDRIRGIHIYSFESWFTSNAILPSNIQTAKERFNISRIHPTSKHRIPKPTPFVLLVIIKLYRKTPPSLQRACHPAPDGMLNYCTSSCPQAIAFVSPCMCPPSLPFVRVSNSALSFPGAMRLLTSSRSIGDATARMFVASRSRLTLWYNHCRKSFTGQA